MSIHHEVTIHCDGCGQWMHGSEWTTAQRRRLGWRIWQQWGDAGRWLHLCPACPNSALPDYLRTEFAP